MEIEGKIVNPILVKPQTLQDVFDIDVIREFLFGYMSIKDLKALRTTCKANNAFVGLSDFFLRNSQLVVTEEAIESGVPQNTEIPWKHVVLNLLTITEEGANLVKSLISTVQSVSLRCPQGESKCNLCDYLMKLFDGLNNLKNFELDYSLYERDISKIFELPKSRSIFENLDTLVLHVPMRNRYYYLARHKDLDGKKSFFWRENFKGLTEIPFRLRHLAIGHISCWNTDAIVDISIFVAAVLKSSEDTLEVLRVNASSVDVAILFERYLKKLKHLEFSLIRAHAVQNVLLYIPTQPLVEILVLDFVVALPIDILELLPTVSTECKRLCILAKSFPIYHELTSSHWNFLSNITSLRHIFLGFENFKSDVERKHNMLSYLPLNISTCSLIGQPLAYTAANFANFSKLTKLNLMGSKDQINDDVFMGILASCKNLLELHLDRCERLTDRSLEAWWGGDQSARSDTLKGITRLTLLNCVNITQNGILNLLVFKYLQYFAFRGRFEFTSRAVLKIAKRNPSMDDLFIPLDTNADMEGLLKVRRRLSLINPRLNLHLINAYHRSFISENKMAVPTSELIKDRFVVKPWDDCYCFQPPKKFS